MHIPTHAYIPTLPPTCILVHKFCPIHMYLLVHMNPHIYSLSYIRPLMSFFLFLSLSLSLSFPLSVVMEAKDHKDSHQNSQRSRQSSYLGTPSHKSHNPSLNAQALGEKLRIAKLRLPEVDPDSVFD